MHGGLSQLPVSSHKYPCSACSWRMDRGRVHFSQGWPYRFSFPLLISPAYNYPASPMCTPSPHAYLLLFLAIVRTKFISAPDLVQLQWAWNGQHRFHNTAWPPGRRSKSRAIIRGLKLYTLLAQMPGPCWGLTLKGRILTAHFFSN